MSGKRLTLALLVVACLGAVGAPNAFAGKGELLNLEGKALVKSKFTGTVGKSTLETIKKAKLTCESGTLSGTVSNTKTAEGGMVLVGCTSNGESCKTAGAKEGEIALAPALSVLPYPVAPTTYGLKEVVITCPKAELKVKGSFLVPIGAAQEKVFQTEFKFTAEQKEGTQIPLEGENSAKEKFRFTLEASFGEGFVQAGFAATITIKYEELAEYV